MNSKSFKHIILLTDIAMNCLNYFVKNIYTSIFEQYEKFISMVNGYSHTVKDTS